MSERNLAKHIPNESKEYRSARDALLNDEQALIDATNELATRRRQLPRGGRLNYGLAVLEFARLHAGGTA